MSKLDDIVALNENVPSEDIKQQVKDLMLELIGKDVDELPELDNPSIPYTARKYESRGCNKTKKDLRQKVKSL